jgi:Bax protein
MTEITTTSVQHALKDWRIWAGVGLVALAISLFQLFQSSSALVLRWDVEISADPLPVAAVEEAFTKIGYNVDNVRESGHGVPRVLVRTMPDDLGQVPEVARRKSLFLGAVLPLALAVNEQISFERAELARMAEKLAAGRLLSASEEDELVRLARVYRVIDDETVVAELNEQALVDELLLRVAPLPVSLVLAQAAEESAWGLSRFAAEGNALYGQWVWNDEIGIVPKDRPEGQTHSVRAFRDIYESTLSYAHNLNTHPAYGNFRRLRAEMLKDNAVLDGMALAGTLTRYSGRGQAYIDSLRTIMRGNDLPALDRAQFIDRMKTQAVDTRADATPRG